MGVSWVKSKKRRKKREKKRGERERLNDGENNGQATHGARKHAWRTQAAWAKNSDFVILQPFLAVAQANPPYHMLNGSTFDCLWVRIFIVGG